MNAHTIRTLQLQQHKRTIIKARLELRRIAKDDESPDLRKMILQRLNELYPKTEEPSPVLN